MAHYPALLAVGVTVGVGIALYSNKDAIIDFAAEKLMELKTRADRKRNRQLRERLTRGSGTRNGGSTVTGVTSDTTLGESYEMRDRIYNVDSDDDIYDDTYSVHTREFMSNSTTKYYTSGTSSSMAYGSSAGSFSTSTAVGTSTDVDAGYMRQGDFLVRRGGGGGGGVVGGGGGGAIERASDRSGEPFGYQAGQAGNIGFNTGYAQSVATGSEESLGHWPSYDSYDGSVPGRSQRSSFSEIRTPSLTTSRTASISEGSILHPVLSRDSAVSDRSGDSYSEISTPTVSAYGSEDDEIYVRDVDEQDGESLALGLRRLRARQQTIPPR